MARETYLTEQLREAHRDLEGARADRSWQAVSHLRRQALQIRLQLDELADQRRREAEAAPPEEDELTNEELMAALIGAIRELPDAQLDDILDAIAARRQVEDGGDDDA